DADIYFQVRLKSRGIGRHVLGRRPRPPVSDAIVGLSVARVHCQRGYAAEKRLVSFRQAGLNPLDEVREPERMDAVPAPFVRPIVQRHGSASSRSLSRTAAAFASQQDGVPYAEGVEADSPGSRSAPWVTEWGA